MYICMYVCMYVCTSLLNWYIHVFERHCPYNNSQVSAISWNRESREIISSHGNPKNQLTVWKYPSMCKVGEVLGHEGRILQMNLSPRRSSVATISADETLRVWKCFDQPKSTDSSQSCTEDSISALIRSVP